MSKSDFRYGGKSLIKIIERAKLKYKKKADIAINRRYF